MTSKSGEGGLSRSVELRLCWPHAHVELFVDFSVE